MAGLVRRKPIKRIKISKAAELIGCSSESIRNGRVGPFRLFKLNPDRVTSPWLMYEADLNAFLERREAGNFS
jgi:hypothetical protein